MFYGNILMEHDMKLETFLNLFLSVNDKFKKIQNDENNELYCEVLHSTLTQIFKDLTEERYNSIPLPTRQTIEKLENQILARVSIEYRQAVEDFRKENGKFMKKNLAKRLKAPIGFNRNWEEELTQ